MSDLNEIRVKNEAIFEIKDCSKKCSAFIPFPKGMIWKMEAMSGVGILISTFEGLLQVIIQPEQFKEIFGEEDG